MASFQTGDSVGAVVADIGNYATKIGWAGDDSPRSYFRSTVAVERQAMQTYDDNNDSQQPEQHPGRITAVHYDSYHLKGDTWRSCNPINHTTGLMYDPSPAGDWHDLLPQFLQHGYDTALHQTQLSDHPLLLAERSYTPPPIRQQVIECLFEEANVPAAFLAKDAVLSCYACGRTTATVVDMGYSGTTVTPVVDGFVERKGIRRSPVGVKAMDEYLLTQMDQLYVQQQQRQQKPEHSQIRPLYQLQSSSQQSTAAATTTQRRPSMHHLARLQIAQDCRELGAGAAMNLVDNSNSTSSAFHAPHKTFALPDGTILDVPSKVRFATANMIFGDGLPEEKQKAFKECRQELEILVQSASAAAKDPAVSVEESYSAAAAVGISKRQTKKNTSKTKPPAFCNRTLQAACTDTLNSLQTDWLVDLLHPAAADQDNTTTTTPTSAASLPQMICASAYRCDRDQQAALLATVVLGGGGACVGPTDQAAADSVRESTEAVLHQHTAGWRVKVLSPAQKERAILTWLGGSILGSLGTFPELWISKAEYEEWGAAIVNRKCP